MRSLRARLSVWIVSALTCVFAALSIGLYAVFTQALWRQFDARLEDETHALANLVRARHDSTWEFERGRFPDFEPGDRTGYYQIWTDDNSVLARSPSLGSSDLPSVFGHLGFPMLSSTRLPDGRSGRAIQSTVLVPGWSESDHALFRTPIEHPVTIVVARGTEDIDATLATVRFWLLSLAATTLVVAAGASTFIVGRALRPTAQLGKALADINDRDLGQPIDVPGLPKELEPPVAMLNELLGRLAQSFARERRFSADVSHELRTPLAALRTILEVAASRDRTATEYRRAIDEATAVARQMHVMVETLLMLAKVDANQLEVSREHVVLRELVDDVWCAHAAGAASRKLTFRNNVDPAASVVSDRDKLRVILNNLISNAVEYTEETGTIVVRDDRAGGFALEVCDSGPPIPPAALPRLFDRFFRADAARSGGLHCGIGLALAKNLCSLLGLTLTASNMSDGSVSFRLADTLAQDV